MIECLLQRKMGTIIVLKLIYVIYLFTFINLAEVLAIVWGPGIQAGLQIYVL